MSGNVGISFDDGSKVAGTANPLPVVLGAGSTTPRVEITDGSANNAGLVQGHNADNQAFGSGYGILTAGVAQLLQPATGLLDRQRETGANNVPASGIASGTQQLKSPISTTVTAGGGAGATTVTLTATKFTNNGAPAWIQPGTVLTMEPGTANQESVRVSGVNYGTNVCTIVGTGAANGFQFSHVNTSAVTAGAYNEAVDATAPEGSSGAGIGLSGTTLFNSGLNAGAGGWEYERSAAGELDGATGKGTAVAAEYEYNGGPLSFGNVSTGFNYDRARNLQGKALLSGTLSNNPLAANSTTLNLNAAPVGLLAGAQIVIDRAGTGEINYVGSSYVSGATAVPLMFGTLTSHVQNATVEWDASGAQGPGLNGFNATGVGIEEECVYDPVTKLFYIERAATQDGVSGQNVVMESLALWNGASMDRVQGDANKNLKVAPQSYSVEITAAPTISTSAYVAGNVLGGVLTLANAVRAGQLSGILNSIRVSCKSVQTTALKFYVFNANPGSSTFTDHAAPSINAADYAKLIGVYMLSSVDSGLGTHTSWNLDGIGKILQLPATSLYVVPVVVGTPTFASTTDVTFGFAIAQD